MIEDEDPNEAYDVEIIPDGGLMSSHGWWQCKQNGIVQWFGPEERMRQLATDPAERIEARKSKKHHGQPPTVSTVPPSIVQR